MPVDASIPLMTRMPQIDLPSVSRGRVLDLAAKERANRQGAIEERDNSDLREALFDPSSFQTAEDGSISVNKPALLSTLTRKNPYMAYATGQKLAQQELSLQESKEKVSKERLETAMKTNEIIGTLAQSVTDQTSYDIALARAGSLGLPGIEQMPKEYNPDFVKSLKTGYLSTKDQLAQAWKVADFNLRVQEMNSRLADRESAAADRATARDDRRFNAVREAENRLRNSFQKDADGFKKTKDMYTRLMSAATPGTKGQAQGPKDISLLYAYMKLLDPESVVREGEFATAKNAGSVPDRVKIAYNNALNGSLLTPALRQSFVQEGQRLYERSVGDFTKLSQIYTDIAVRNGVNPSNIVIDYTTTAPAAVPTGEKTMSRADVLETMRSSGRTEAQVRAAAEKLGFKIVE